MGKSLLQRKHFNCSAPPPRLFCGEYILLMLCGGSIPPRGVRRKPNLETAQTSPVNHAVGIQADFGTKTLVQPPGFTCTKISPHCLHVRFATAEPKQYCSWARRFRSAKVLCKLLQQCCPHFLHAKAGLAPCLSRHLAS